MQQMNSDSNDTTRLLTRKEVRDLKVLLQFTAVYCREQHVSDRAAVSTAETELQNLPLRRYPVCSACRNFLLYALERRLRCPLAEKPLCKHCRVHCYKPEYRQKVREIMRFSGQYLIRRGRLDLLWHFIF